MSLPGAELRTSQYMVVTLTKVFELLRLIGSAVVKTAELMGTLGRPKYEKILGIDILDKTNPVSLSK